MFWRCSQTKNGRRSRQEDRHVDASLSSFCAKSPMRLKQILLNLWSNPVSSRKRARSPCGCTRWRTGCDFSQVSLPDGLSPNSAGRSAAALTQDFAFGESGRRLDNQRDSVTRGRFALGLLVVITFGLSANFAAIGCLLTLASNSRSAESQCSSARPSSRPVEFQIS